MFRRRTNFPETVGEVRNMEMKSKYYVVRDRALPEVLLKVAKVKRLLDADKAMTVQ